MLIKSNYRVFEAAGAGITRPTLGCVYIEADREAPDVKGWCHGVARATDGYILAVVPVEVAPDDVVGLVGADAFKAAFLWSKRMKIDPVELKLDLPDFVGLADGSMVRRFDNGQVAGDFSQFPDVTAIIPKKRVTFADREVNGRHLLQAAINPGYLRRLVRSIGCQWADSGVGAKGDAMPRLVFGATVGQHGACYDPIIVESQNASVGASFVPPFGLLMPMHGSESDYWKQGVKNS